MSKLRPVKRSYTPGYPRRLSEAELREILHPALRRRFSKEVMLLSTVLVGSTLSSCARVAPGDEPAGAASGTNFAAPGASAERKPLPNLGKSTRTDPQLKEKVDQLVKEVLPKKPGMWNERSQVTYHRLIAANPVNKVPYVQISFGNSINGIFNVKEAAEATEKLFAAYGIPLETDVKLAGDGYEFEADGYNEELGVGFEIRNVSSRGTWLYSESEEKAEGPAFLSEDELPALEKDVVAGKRDVFVSDPYTLYDGDQSMAMSYYLASVVDYLNWIHGDREIDYTDILGERKNKVQRGASHFTEQAVYWSAQTPNFTEGWSIDRGEIGVVGEGANTRIRLSLEPGATATCKRPVDEATLAQLSGVVRWNLTSLAPGDIPVDLDFRINGFEETRKRMTRIPGESNDFTLWGFGYPDDAPRAIDQMTITNVNGFKVELEVSKISWMD